MAGNPRDNSRIVITKELHGTAPATTANYGKFFVATSKCVVKKISEVHTTKGSHGSAVTLQVERLQGTETSGNGDNLLATAFNLKGDAETVQTGTLTTTVANLVLSAGDRLNLVDAGTPTAVAGLCVVVELELVD